MCRAVVGGGGERGDNDLNKIEVKSAGWIEKEGTVDGLNVGSMMSMVRLPVGWTSFSGDCRS